MLACGSNIIGGRQWAKQHGLEVGIFGALHNYGRGLNWHPHIHLSVTRGGLDKHNIWRPIYFKKKHVEYHWRRCLIGSLRRKYGELNLSTSGTNHIQDSRQWHFFLERQYKRYWNIHFARKTQELKQTVNYLGRYLKRPSISASRLRHYSGRTVVFKYLDHRDGKYKTKALTQEEMILRYISHIPQHHFKMVRYYGFLSNRKRGRLLPLAYLAQGEKAQKQAISWLNHHCSNLCSERSHLKHSFISSVTFMRSWLGLKFLTIKSFY